MLKKMKKATWKVLAETFHVAFLQNAIKRGFVGGIVPSKHEHFAKSLFHIVK